MKTLIYLFFIAATAITTYGQASKGITITVVFENLVSDQGKVSAALYNEGTFMKAAPLKTAEGKPENKALTLVLENVIPGEYGIVTLHDYNENGRMDFEANGMPLEPYGMSNNAMVMGPPTFTDAKFEVTNEDITLKIRM